MAAGKSFEEFYAATVDRLLGHLFLVTGDLHIAEELLQEAFTRASMRWSYLRGYDRPEAWVRRVAMNLAADRARSLRRPARAGPGRRRRRHRPAARTAGAPDPFGNDQPARGHDLHQW